MNKTIFHVAAFLLAGLTTNAFAADTPDGKAVYDRSCAACHATGAAGAPKVGDVAAWAPRIKTGAAALFASATKGKGVMPPRGGNPALTDAEIKAVVAYMMAQAKPASSATPSAATVKAEAAATKPAPAPAPAQAPSVTANPAPTATVAAAPTTPASGANVNTFNRLMRPAAAGNLPPTEDGPPDPSNEGPHSFQPPLACLWNFVQKQRRQPRGLGEVFE